MTEIAKDTRIPWIGEIPESWMLVKLKRTTYLKGRINWHGVIHECVTVQRRLRRYDV